MLTKTQVSEIKEHLDKAQNPIFFFDNDPDGLCSFVIMRKFCEKGKGVAVKSYPSMDKDYFRRVIELGADYIFILDKPIVEQDFFDEAEKVNIPVVWIDHHEVQVKVPKYVNYYNPTLNKKKTNEPVTHLCYQISQRKEDMWLDIIGCISDHFVPETYKEFMKEFPDLAFDSEKPKDILYKSQIGKVAMMLSFALKDTTTNVVSMMKFLVKAKNSYDVLEETKENKSMHQKFSQINQKYEKLLDKAKSLVDNKKLLFFQYSGDTSMSSDLSNELNYLFPEKIIVVMRVIGAVANISARGKRAKEIIAKALEGIEDSRSGGHEEAVGGQMLAKDIERFKENIERLIK
ncbi:MAG: DHH family phosphoesterase [Candidatus Pacearchaeota archaeon]